LFDPDPGSPHVSPQTEKRLQHFEDCQTAIDQLLEASLRDRGPSGFLEFLEFARRFTNLSVYNAMLVEVQRRGAMAVGSARDWDRVGRHVNPDAVPIVVLHPFGPVRFLYAEEDTSGTDIPGEEHHPLHAKGELNEEVYRWTVMAAQDYEIFVEEVGNYGSGLAGTAATLLPGIRAGGKVVGPFWRVKLNSKSDLPTRFSTLTHELGHIYCGHLGRDPKGRWPDRRDLTFAQQEVEAESVSWIVCRRAGLQTRSEDYINIHAKDSDLSKVSAYAIFEAANRIESRTRPKPLTP
jgi:hypothetical protein